MTNDEKRIQHLQMIQAIIARMAGNSFLIKGWSVTLATGTLALADRAAAPEFIFVIYLPASLFWLLDAYFLSQERLYRKLYQLVCRSDSIDFDMSTDGPRFADVAGLARTCWSGTIAWFHGMIIAAVLGVYLISYWAG